MFVITANIRVMTIFIITLIIAIFSTLGLLAIRSSVYSWLCFFATLTITLQINRILPNWFCGLSWLLISISMVFSVEQIRYKWLSTKLLEFMTKKFKKFIPMLAQDQLVVGSMSKFEMDLFHGSLDVNALLHTPNYDLTNQEQNFLNNQVEELCKILNDWKITQDKIRLPADVWDYLKNNRFFCMNLPAEVGGLGFSLRAVFEVIQKIATHNITAAVMVMVPNSINLSKILLDYGTKAQIEHYLPKLTAGEYIPSLVLAAHNSNNKGVICYKKFQDQEVLGVCLNWEHDCIALAPIANLLVLSVNLYDPHDFLCLNKKELGNNFCLVPSNLPNVFNNIKRAASQDFLNGPTKGREVFIPLNYVLGSKEVFGQNAQIIINNLLITKNITCLALSSAISKLCFKNISAHVVVNNINRVDDTTKLAKIGGYNYMLVAARELLLTVVRSNNCSDTFVTMMRHHINNISKNIFNNTIDIYKGNITLGIKNYLAISYQDVFAGRHTLDTLEQQGLLKIIIKSHQFLKAELESLQTKDVGLFDHYFFNHISYTLGNFAKLLLHVFSNKVFFGNLTRIKNNYFQKYYKDVKLFSVLFANLLDISLLYLDQLSDKDHRLLARLLDIFKHLFMICAVIKYYSKHKTEPREEYFAIWSTQVCLYNIQQAIIGFLHNFPNKLLAKLLNIVIFPLGKKYYMPNDELDLFIKNTIINNSNIRTRLLFGCYFAVTDHLEFAFRQKAAQETLC